MKNKNVPANREAQLLVLIINLPLKKASHKPLMHAAEL